MLPKFLESTHLEKYPEKAYPAESYASKPTGANPDNGTLSAISLDSPVKTGTYLGLCDGVVRDYTQEIKGLQGSAAILDVGRWAMGCRGDTASLLILTKTGAVHRISVQDGSVRGRIVLSDWNSAAEVGALSTANGGLVVIGQHDGTLTLKGLTNSTIQATIKLPKTRALALAFNPRGDALLVGGADGKMYLYEIALGTDTPFKRLPDRYVGAGSAVSALAWHPSERVFFSGDWHGGLVAWLQYDFGLSPTDRYVHGELFPGLFHGGHKTVQHGVTNDRDGVERIILDKAGKFLFVFTQNGWIEQWQVRGFRRVASTEALHGLVYVQAVNDAGDMIATLGRDGVIRLWQSMLKPPSPGEERVYELTLRGEQASEELSYMRFIGNDTLLCIGVDGQVALLPLATFEKALAEGVLAQ